MALIGLKSLRSSLTDLDKAETLIQARSGDIIVTGIGKSGSIAEKLASTLTSLGHRSLYLHPVDAIHGDIGALSEGDVLLALSFSGESKEIVRLSTYAKREFNVPVISFTRSQSSTLGRLSNVVVKVLVRKEGSPADLAPMASTTATLVLGDMLASMLTRDNFKKDHFARFHPGGGLGLELKKVESLMKKGNALPKVKETDNARKVLKEMSDKSLGVTAVVDKNKKIVGAITDGDIRRWLLKKGDVIRSTAHEIMTRNPKVINSGASLKEALRTMEDHRITTIFVVDKSLKPQGVIHIHDIVEENIV
ncbi:KpsF/GutQ family sugar-phosphate isomerase [Candidatus Parcubacteria bacterium]|nr:KpsF/GutQ family sugar-phosphate isomerase [Candidatus Parcubacteria bacterium]